MKIKWKGPHCFAPDLGEIKLGDERTVDYEYGHRLIKNDLADEVLIKKEIDVKVKEK